MFVLVSTDIFISAHTSDLSECPVTVSILKSFFFFEIFETFSELPDIIECKGQYFLVEKEGFF